jgi:hypothetical protein
VNSEIFPDDALLFVLHTAISPKPIQRSNSSHLCEVVLDDVPDDAIAVKVAAATLASSSSSSSSSSIEDNRSASTKCPALHCRP